MQVVMDLAARLTGEQAQLEWLVRSNRRMLREADASVRDTNSGKSYAVIVLLDHALLIALAPRAHSVSANANVRLRVRMLLPFAQLVDVGKSGSKSGADSSANKCTLSPHEHTTLRSYHKKTALSTIVILLSSLHLTCAFTKMHSHAAHCDAERKMVVLSTGESTGLECSFATADLRDQWVSEVRDAAKK